MYTFEKLEIGVGGVAPCKRCVNPKPQFHSIERISAQVSGQENVMFAGFEPFAHPHLVSLLQHPAFTTCNRLGIQTDGGALVSSGNVAGTLQSGITLYEFVLRGGDQLSHEELTGRAGLFGSALAGIKNTREVADAQGNEIFITGVIPICRHNAEHFLSTVSTFTQTGVDAIRIESKRLIPPEQIAAAYEIAIPSGILIFGDYCDHLLETALYSVVGGEGSEQ